jgi:uncharacterized protein (TIGR03083 family)
MELTPQTFDDLIGAYALDACEPEEVVAIDEYVARRPAAAREVERLREAAAAIGSAGALQPPSALRDRLLSVVNEPEPAATARQALETETERFDAMLDALQPEMLELRTENGLSVHELVAHVEAVDRAFVDEADNARYGFIGAAEAALITDEVLPQHAGEPFAETVARFRRTRRELIELADRIPESHRLAGYARDDTLVIRAFETWTHCDDIARATGLPAVPSNAASMHRMAELAMHSLPLAMAVRGTDRSTRTARFVMTGPGGGAWTIACGSGEPHSGPPDVEIEVSIVDFCRRFADRVAPDAIPLRVTGDTQLARELVSAANAFAGL